MSLHEAVLPGTLLLLAASVLGVVLLARGRHVVLAACLAITVTAALTPGAFLAWDRSPLLHPTSMHVDGLNKQADAGLTVAMTHHLVSEDGTVYAFVARGGPSHVAAVFADQHAGSVSTAADPVLVSDGSHSIWHLAHDNVRYELVATTASDGYELVTQAVTLIPEDGSASLRIPFPSSAFGATEVKEGQIYADGWTQEQWAEFYEGVTEVGVDGNTITVPTDAGTTASITLSEGISKVTLND
jgi:hypothetical protein